MDDAVSDKQIVIARYKEDISWTKDLPPDWLPLVVQKTVDDKPGHLPNTGREPASFLYAIAKNYSHINPDDTWAFVQGNPFDHCPDLIGKLSTPITKYTPLGGHVIKTTDATGNPDHPNLPMAEKYEEWLQKPWPGSLDFTPGGQFMVRGYELLRRPKDWYLDMMDESTTGYQAYIFERLWSAVFM